MIYSIRTVLASRPCALKRNRDKVTLAVSLSAGKFW